MRTPGIIKTNIWLDIRKAARLLGKKRLVANWRDSILDEDSDQSPILREILSDLHAITSSNSVTCLIDQGDEPHRLSPEEARHFAFRIDIAGNYVELGRFPGEKWNMEINGIELEKFLSRYSIQLSEVEKFERCRQWLVEKMREEPRQTKDRVCSEARSLFEISRNAFERAWCDALRETNSGWDAAGRPKSSH